MGFSSLRLYHFRNLIDAHYNFPSKEIFLIGENGQGKTNCLEALYLLCYGSSFRTRNDAHLIYNQEESASIYGTYASDKGLSHEISVILKRKDEKEIRLNGKRISDRKEILLSIPCVVFSHDDLEFVIGSPAKKRRFFNQTLCMYDIQYIDLLRNYKKVLFQRNSLLKQKRSDFLTIYNQQLAEFGFEVQNKRSELVRLFNIIFNEHFHRISGLKGRIEIQYRPSWQNCTSPEACRLFLEKREEQDWLYRTTTTGPHRDQYNYTYEKTDFCHIASTGQLRLLSIILRMAQASFYSENAGKLPVLLLDDVLLELDRKKRELFVKGLPDYEQAFFTFLPDEEYTLYQRKTTAYYHVFDGKIEPWKELEIF
jgi:DNA replication and repair protein RecF